MSSLIELERAFDDARDINARNRVAIEILRATETVGNRSERDKSPLDPEAVRVRARAAAHFNL